MGIHRILTVLRFDLAQFVLLLSHILWFSIIMIGLVVVGRVVVDQRPSQHLRLPHPVVILFSLLILLHSLSPPNVRLLDFQVVLFYGRCLLAARATLISKA